MQDTNKRQKALVVGGGSIGTRHLRNLVALGVSDLVLVDPEPHRRKNLAQEMGLEAFATLDQAWTREPDFVVIASPSHLHGEQALDAARRGCPLFIEKPLSHTREGLGELVEEIERRGLISLVGCNMRFHPGPARIKQLLEDQAIGKLLSARVYTGSYLPEWRPWQDYRKSYSANADAGGGCILDCIHEIDLTRWYIGEVTAVFCAANHLSLLEIDAEDVAAMVFRHANGVVSEVHLDYVQRTYERGCRIIGEHGSIFWDYSNGTVRWFNAKQGSWETFAQPKEWRLNQMYVDELRHFLDCVRTGQQTCLPISDAVRLMRVVFAAKASVASGRLEPVEETLS